MVRRGGNAVDALVSIVLCLAATRPDIISKSDFTVCFSLTCKRSLSYFAFVNLVNHFYLCRLIFDLIQYKELHSTLIMVLTSNQLLLAIICALLLIHYLHAIFKCISTIHIL